ncbi:MAG: hypothetical protein OEZ48_00200 [Candidatus Bathyarchaeota archaeon]|nr:hypothetical protein [Candidatus Bathyarchaeota archaeon]
MAEDDDSLLIVTVLLILIVIAVYSSKTGRSLTFGIPSTGNIVTRSGGASGDTVHEDLHVYWDEDGGEEVQQISWGTLYPGDSKTNTLYLKNEGNPVILKVNITTGNWNPPEAEQYLTFTAAIEKDVLSPKETTLTIWTLQVDPQITGVKEFSFDIIVDVENVDAKEVVENV